MSKISYFGYMGVGEYLDSTFEHTVTKIAMVREVSGYEWALRFDHDTGILARVPIEDSGPVKLMGKWPSVEAAISWLDGYAHKENDPNIFTFSSVQVQTDRLENPNAGWPGGPPVTDVLTL